MRRAITLVFALVFTITLAACGGGGGDDSSAPGELRLIAAEGAAAPGTAGVFLAIPDQPVMDAANGGWCAYVLPTTDGTKTKVLYVVQPDGTPTIVEVFAIGDSALTPGGGTISDIRRVWMCDDGTVMAFINVTGDTNGVTFGVVSAVVAAGTAGQKNGVIFSGRDLTPIGGDGNLTGFDVTTACKGSNGTLWFRGQDNGADLDLFSVMKDGTSLTRRAAVGDAVGAARGGGVIVTIDHWTVDASGSVFCIVVTASAGALERIIARGTGLNVEFFGTGDLLPGVGTAIDAFKGTRLIAFVSGQIIWVCEGSQGGTDDVLMLYEPLNMGVPYSELARSGDTAPDTGMGTIGTIRLLNNVKSAVLPGVQLQVISGINGISQAIYRVLGAGNNNLDPDSSNVRIFMGGFVPAAWVNLSSFNPDTGAPYPEVSQNGSILFAQSFGGTSTLIWSVGGFPFTLAEPGDATPDGDTFVGFATGFEGVTANDVALFRANVTTAGSALYRRGP